VSKRAVQTELLVNLCLDSSIQCSFELLCGTQVALPNGFWASLLYTIERVLLC